MKFYNYLPKKWETSNFEFKFTHVSVSIRKWGSTTPWAKYKKDIPCGGEETYIPNWDKKGKKKYQLDFSITYQTKRKGYDEEFLSQRDAGTRPHPQNKSPKPLTARKCWVEFRVIEEKSNPQVEVFFEK